MIKGGIIIWSGAIVDIPTGYALCDGNNGTPDLRDQFVIGAKQDDGGVPKATIDGGLAQSGGAANHSHTLLGDAQLGGVPGLLDKVTDAQYNYSPCYALAFIMKL